MTDFNEATWLRSSFCASGACLEASRAGRLVLVRDSKQAASTGLIQQWARDEWEDLLHAVKLGAIMTVHHPAIDPHGDQIYFGLHRHETLVFDGATEWAAFVKGVRAGEFEYAKLPTYASTLSSSAPSGGYGAGLAQVGPGFGTRSDQVVTGAGDTAVPPVPVTATETIRADQLTPGRTVLIPMTESLETVTQVRVRGSYVAVHTNGTGPDYAYQWPAGEEVSAVVAVPPVPVTADPTIGEALCADGIHEADRPCCAPVPVTAQPPVSGPQLVPAEWVGEHLWERIGRLASCQRCGVIKGYVGAAEPCRGRVLVELRELMEPAVPVAATPRYILDRDAVMELVERYGEAERDAADSFIRPDRKMAARDEADDLLRAIRAALTPIPAVEPEPAWGSGPLVEHNPETPVPTTPGTGSAVPDREEIERRDRLAKSWAEDD